VYRGRVFSLYDMIFNVGQVSAAALGALILPDDGKSYPVLAFIVLGFLLSAFCYARSSAPERGDRLDGGGFPGRVGAGEQPDQGAQ
jgi:hypothetical protein